MKTTRQSRRLMVHALLTSTVVLMAGWGAGCTNHVVYRERGWDNYRQENWSAALDDFQSAADKKPTDFLSQYYLGVTQLKLEQPVAAQIALEQAMTLRPGDPEWTPRIADALAEAYYQQDRYETLYAFLDNMVTTYHQQPRDFMRKAEYLGKMGDADGQKVALEKAGYFALPGNAEPYTALADFYIQANDVPAAIQALKYGYWANPESTEVQNRLRGLGVVPGPTIAAEPPKPALMR